MSEELRECYKKVFYDMRKVPLFSGIYDAENSSEEFMHGICTVMEYIANSISMDNGQKFSDVFSKMMSFSQDIAREKEQK